MFGWFAHPMDRYARRRLGMPRTSEDAAKWCVMLYIEMFESFPFCLGRLWRLLRHRGKDDRFGDILYEWADEGFACAFARRSWCCQESDRAVLERLLIPLLEDEDKRIRLGAVMHLGLFGGEDASKALKALYARLHAFMSSGEGAIPERTATLSLGTSISQIEWFRRRRSVS